jgi:predicted amidohydrolase
MALRSRDILGWMSEICLQYRAAITGSLPTGPENNITNTMVFVDAGGKVLARYDKIHLFSVTGENGYFSSGDRIVAKVWKNIKIGFAVCFDLRFPEMIRLLCVKGVELLLVSAQWPLDRIDHFRDLVRVRAMENQMFVAACNSCGEDQSGLVLGGGSLVADPSGRIVRKLGADEGVLSVEISLNEVARIREDFPVVTSRRRDIFGDW